MYSVCNYNFNYRIIVTNFSRTFRIGKCGLFPIAFDLVFTFRFCVVSVMLTNDNDTHLDSTMVFLIDDLCYFYHTWCMDLFTLYSRAILGLLGLMLSNALYYPTLVHRILQMASNKTGFDIWF